MERRLVSHPKTSGGPPPAGKRQMIREGQSWNVRFALLPVMLAIGGWARVGRVEAAVVVVCNRSDETVKLRLEPVWGASRDYSLAPGELVQVQVPHSVELIYTRGDTEIRRPIDPNSVHNFVKKREDLVLEQVSISQSRSSRWLHVEGQEGPPGEVVVPVKILVDSQQAAAGADWEVALRGQLAAASKSIEGRCGVRFEVAGVEHWQWEHDESDFRRLDAQFRKMVATDPAWLAIGLCEQFRISEKTPLPHLNRKPLFTHLLLPDVQEGFSETDQLELLVHELGHFLGAAHSPENDSVMRSPIPEKDEERGRSGTDFDALNTLAMNLVADEIRTGRVRRLGEISRGTRGHLRTIYWEMARRVRKDRQSAHLAELLRETAFSGPRYTGQWTDGSRRAGDEVAPWHQTESAPALAARPLFAEGHSIRWLLDNSLAPADRPRAVVEFVGGDCLPGRVVGVESGEESPTHRLPPHLVVVPYVRLDFPGGPARPQIRVITDWVRRIVWTRVADRYHPRTLLLRDGRRLDFRSVRLTATSIRLLREEGIREVALSDVAELHFPQLDPWETYFQQLAELSPDGTSRLVELETADGLRATSSSERFQAHCHGSQEDPAHWYHLVQPAWSLDPFWLCHHTIRLRRYFMPQEVPLSRIDPVGVSQQSDLGGTWRWRVDRNVEGGPLHSGGLAYQWGFGVHAGNELEFPLPHCARAFHTHLGLDQLAGEGGCVDAKILVGSTAAKPAFASGTVVGSAKVLSSGRLEVDTSSGTPGRLVLRVDAAHDKRPSGADPFDVRDTFDWLEPILELDPHGMQAEVLRQAPRRIPAWRDWQVATGEAEAARLANRWDQTDSRQPTYRLMTVSDQAPLKLSRRLRVGPERNRLLLAVSRPSGTAASKIEVYIEGEPVEEFEVPIRSSREAPEPLVVSLSDYEGRQLTVEVIQKAEDVRDHDQQALVEWRAITLAGPPDEASGDDESGK